MAFVNVDRNLERYNNADAVAFYARATELLPPERYIFNKYLRQNLDILDIGVGGGRTTRSLAPGSRRYLGLDYASAMIAACKARFPGLDFRLADATDLSFLPDDSFDFTVFSFNGIDYIPTDEGRIACLKEMRRVTRPEGIVVISSHNARALGVYPDFSGAHGIKKGWRLVRAAVLSVSRAPKTMTSPAYRRGSGYIMDSVHGGLKTHVSTPESISRDCRLAGLDVLEIVSAHHPHRVGTLLNPWTTYVLKRGAN